MSDLTIKKVNALPDPVEANTIYLVKRNEEGLFDLCVVDSLGVSVRYASSASVSASDIIHYSNVAPNLPSEKPFWCNVEDDILYVQYNDNGNISWVEVTASSTDTILEGTINLYFTEARAAAAAPVQSVAGKTGAIELTISDITDLASVLSQKAASVHAHSTATTSEAGFMSASDKSKLDGIQAGANNYSHPTSGVAPATYRSVTVNDQGHVTAGSNPTTLTGYGITDAINVNQIGVPNGVAGLDSNGLISSSNLPSYVDDVLEYATLASMPAIGETGKIYLALDTGRCYRWTGSYYLQVNNSVSSADTANSLATSRTINGTSFNGTANIETSYWGATRTLTIGSTGKSVNGSGNVSWSIAEIGAAPASHVGDAGGAHAVATTSVNGFMAAGDKSKLDGIQAGAQVNSVTSVAGRTGAVALTKADVGLSNVDNTADSSKSVASAALLSTARTINGTSFNGSVDITTANWGTARTITIGSTGKSVNGSANISWSLGEIGAEPANAAIAKTNQEQSYDFPQSCPFKPANDGIFNQAIGQNFSCTPTGTVTLTFQNQRNGLAGSVIFVNPNNYPVGRHINTKMSAADLALLSQTGEYRIDYISNGINSYCSVVGGY